MQRSSFALSLRLSIEIDANLLRAINLRLNPCVEGTIMLAAVEYTLVATCRTLLKT